MLGNSLNFRLIIIEAARACGKVLTFENFSSVRRTRIVYNINNGTIFDDILTFKQHRKEWITFAILHNRMLSAYSTIEH